MAVWSLELFPLTIAVRDKVIEKFAGQPLDEMNSSVKALLSTEEDEQKRLGILAARVYILRQRIMSIAEGDPERVVTSASPKPKDLAGEEATDAGGDSETTTSEWTRLRILEDCEVNGVRFPKTVIIDVKSADAERLVENGKAELIEESEPAQAVSEAEADVEAAPEAGIDTPAEDAAPSATEAQPEDEAAADDQPEEATAEPAADAEISDIEAEDPSAMLEALSDEPSAESDALSKEAADESVIDEQEDSSSGEAVIEAPSAAEVTAALEALGAGSSDDAGDNNEDEKAQDAADVAAELAALSTTSDASDNADETSGDAAEVAAALEAASAAMAAGPSNTDITDLPAAGAEQDDAGSEKPAGWFEAQQNAEAAKRDGDKSDDENP
ncbi:MAG: hypothetical protein CM15mP60_1590 [Alphaproteobacteria bacterium]|nr:MAG: hypothetical protein CM15mP60_1590 [Alphaproteobacteria bacterium]